jgi:hypothetical protein
MGQDASNERAIKLMNLCVSAKGTYYESIFNEVTGKAIKHSFTIHTSAP